MRKFRLPVFCLLKAKVQQIHQRMTEGVPCNHHKTIYNPFHFVARAVFQSLCWTGVLGVPLEVRMAFHSFGGSGVLGAPKVRVAKTWPLPQKWRICALSVVRVSDFLALALG